MSKASELVKLVMAHEKAMDKHEDNLIDAMGVMQQAMESAIRYPQNVSLAMAMTLKMGVVGGKVQASRETKLETRKALLAWVEANPDVAVEAVS